MKLSTAISIGTAVLAAATSAAASNITYNVISLVPNNQTLGVIIDDQVYPLTNVNDNSDLLHSGEAPEANSGYKYAILRKDNNQILQSENFTRTTNESKSTLNEYYGRSWNTFSISELPNILPPLPSINRIKSDLHIDGEIPTIHFNGNQAEIDAMHKNQTAEIDIYLNMTYISPNDVKTFHNVSMAVSGHSTRGLDKLSYKLKMDKQDLYGYRKIKLRSMATDLSYMRDNLVYNLANAVGLPTSKYSYARVYINDRAIGLFGVAENLKSPWVRNEFGDGSKKFKQGALYVADPSGGQNMFGSGAAAAGFADKVNGQADQIAQSQNQTDAAHKVAQGIPQNNDVQPSTCDLSYLGNNVTLYTSGKYSVKEDPSVGTANFTRIMDVSKFISEQPNGTNVDNSAVPLWEEKIDVDSFLRGLALEIAVSNSDGYLSMSNNYVLYDDIENERLIFSGQDFDITMGTTFFNISLMHGGNYSEFPGFGVRPVTTRMLAVPQFKQEFEKLLYNITKDLINLETLSPRIDQTAAMIKEDVAWDMSLPRVGSPILLGAVGSVLGNESSLSEMMGNMSFDQAVNGPSVFNMSMSLKEWLSFRSSNLLNFFNQSLFVNTTQSN